MNIEGGSKLIYTIQRKSSLKELVDFLKEYQLEPICLNDNHLEINISEEDLEDFAFILGFYISLEGYKKILWDELLRHKVEESVARDFFDDSVESFHDSNYWVGISKVLVLDYLLEQNVINVDTFPIFNMKGFKKEIKDYVQMHVKKLEENSLSNQSKLTNDTKENNATIHDIISEMKKGFEKSNLNKKDFQKLHLVRSGEGFLIQNNNNEVLDRNFVISNIGIMISFNISEEHDPLISDIMTLMCFCKVFDTEKIVVHNNLSDKAKNMIRGQKSMILNNVNNEVLFEFCDGCLLCEDTKETNEL